jgi:hypothetical protein
MNDNIPLYFGTGGDHDLTFTGTTMIWNMTSGKLAFQDGGVTYAEIHRSNKSINAIASNGGSFQVDGVALTDGFNKFKVVTTLPGTPDSNTIYFVTG